MGKIDPARERERLRKLYAGMSDGELEKVGQDPATLTEWAREVLREEMFRRGLKWQEHLVETRLEQPDDTNVLLVLQFYRDSTKAAEDKAALKQAGIKAHFFAETAPGPEGLISWRPSNGVRLLVRAEELAVSLELLRKTGGSEGNGSTEMGGAESAEREGSKPVVLRSYRDITEAMIDRTTLESAGIECFLYDDNLVRLDWFVSNAIGGVKVVVCEKDVPEAARILAEARS